MTEKEIHAVTGAYGFSGKYIARRLLSGGKRVITLTDSVHRRNPFGETVSPYPFHFDQPEVLEDSLRGVKVLYNTYWVRFNTKAFNYDSALRNVETLFKAAKSAGIERVVHISITNPSEDSPLGYFRGKAKMERALRASGMHYAILRPALLFGEEDILINNIAWALRRFPIFCVFGDGSYRLQPIHVDDLAELAVEQGETEGDVLMDAIGPETFTYRGLVEEIGRRIGKERPVVSVPPALGYVIGKMIGVLVKDVFITRDEIEGLMAGLLCVDSPPAGKTKLSKWIEEHADAVGKRYASELARRKDRLSDYGSL